MKKICIVFLLISTCVFSQTKNNSKKSTTELLQGTWAERGAEPSNIIRFNGDEYISGKDSIVAKHIYYKLKGKKIYIYFKENEPTKYKIYKITDSTLIWFEKEPKDWGYRSFEKYEYDYKRK